MRIFDKRDQEVSLFRQKEERILGRQRIFLRTPHFSLYLHLLILYLVFTRILLKLKTITPFYDIQI